MFGLVKEINVSWHLLKMVRQIVFKGSYLGDRDWSQLQQGQVGIYKAGWAGWGLVDGKLLRGSVRSKGDSCLLHSTELLKTGHSDKILKVGGEEFNQISRMVRCQE